MLNLEVGDRITYEEPCDCGSWVKHNNGGNYHEVIAIERYGKDEYRVIYTDTREVFPGEEGGMCDRCGYTWYKSTTSHECGLTRSDVDAIVAKMPASWYVG